MYTSKERRLYSYAKKIKLLEIEGLSQMELETEKEFKINCAK